MSMNTMNTEMTTMATTSNAKTSTTAATSNAKTLTMAAIKTSTTTAVSSNDAETMAWIIQVILATAITLLAWRIQATTAT